MFKFFSNKKIAAHTTRVAGIESLARIAALESDSTGNLAAHGQVIDLLAELTRRVERLEGRP